MSSPEDKKDELVKTPFGPEEPTTPYGTPEPSQPTAELYLSDRATRDIAQRFDLLAELGRGGMGIVYRARDRETNEIVALKVLKPEIANRPGLIDRFKTELRLARKITHKNVCRSYDLHRFGETVVIAMEYVEGDSLRAVLNRPGGVSLRGGMNWASQVCAALAEAHTQGIVHRDLKPENIVIDRSGQAKVMDFGIARSIDTTTTTGVMTGTPAYMSPEQAEGKPVDARSDIYSLGLILYEMFTGRPGLKAEVPIALALKQIHETPPPPREVEHLIPDFLERAILKCVEKSPKKRFQSVRELEAALTEQSEGKTAAVEAEGGELPIVLTRWQRSDWLLVAAAIAGLALYFPSFNRTSLAPHSKVTFDHSVLFRIAQDYAQRLGVPLGKMQGPYAIVEDPYAYVAGHAGARTALELANNPIPYWTWWVHMDSPVQVEVKLDNRGSLVQFSRDTSGDMPQVQRLSVDEARPLAEKALKDFFGADVAQVALEAGAGGTYGSSGREDTYFTWRDRKSYEGLTHRYFVVLIGREIYYLESNYIVPAGHGFPSTFPQFLPFTLLILLAYVPLGFLQRHQVNPRARWRGRPHLRGL